MPNFLMFLFNRIKELKKLQDSISIGLLSGLIGTIFMDSSNLLIFKAGKSETLYGYIAGALFVPPYRTKQKKNFILGELAHFGIGSIWGIPLFYILKKTGKDHHLVKGIFISMLSLGTLIGGIKFGILKKFRFTKTYYSALWNHLVYGLVSSQVMVLLADPLVFNNSNFKTDHSRQVKDDYNSPSFMESIPDLEESQHLIH
ncbi:hypothetical protein Desaci_1330 [Desulfosporosinus acidiphilus SJ4]|uniref:Uncharacterized protein n=1 Tax=Desulfosporosinus acidiphilus (strain DSM 22704 / JCM 16185 / SJ4) TaxID=646529 RepID=I4D3I2_DESAJ|nr:hypothetical protein [Desulfosporosinus acidiphilus]AFM40356.1 hypothetical protein Desaci_1330 [Desulfosporosinus acidiphilus SJ4]